MPLYELILGLPQTSHRFFSEHHLLKTAGHFQWQAIAAALGKPLSELRTSNGGEVYASFYYIEERIPDALPLESFRLDDTVRFAIALRGYKNISFEGRVAFGKPEQLDDARAARALQSPGQDPELPFIHFANIFITPARGNGSLRVALPAGAGSRGTPELPNEENPFHLTRTANERGAWDLLDGWEERATLLHVYPIDVDRDTNGAGLVYFANYIAFMDSAERLALQDAGITNIEGVPVVLRSLRHRKIGYYGNAETDDTLELHVTTFIHPAHPRRLGFRTVVRRRKDDQLICIAEALKAVEA
jgi:probable biosynthetic protein (TIGR04098 family)